MEMNLGDWMVIIGVLVVLVVLADGLRRIWLTRRKENELSFGLEDIQGQADDFGSELPNGGARLQNGQAHHSQELSDLDDAVPVREEPPFAPEPAQPSPSTKVRVEPQVEPVVEQRVEHRVETKAEAKVEPKIEPQPQPQHKAEPVSFEEPVITDVVSPARVEAEDKTEEVQPQPVTEPAVAPEPEAVTQSHVRKDPSVLPGQQALALDEPVPVLMDMDLRAEPDARRRKPAETRPVREPREPVNMPFPFHVDELEDKARKLRDKIRPSSRKVKSSEPVEVVAKREIEEEPVVEENSQPAPLEEVLVINVKAPEDRPFPGDKLLDIFKKEGLRFGDMNIFHRHVREDGSGQVLFSVANGVEPGTFDLKTIEESTIPALSFFMGLPGPEEPQQAFRILVEAVHHLSRDLGGILRDEQHSVLTGQTLEHYRQRICDFERRHLCQRKKSTARA